MSDQLTTPRAALLAFAAWLDRTDMPAPMPSSVTAQLAREYAENYADEAPGFAVEAAIAAALAPDPYPRRGAPGRRALAHRQRTGRLRPRRRHSGRTPLRGLPAGRPVTDPTHELGGWSLPFEEHPMADLHDAADGVVVGALTVGGAVAPHLAYVPGLVIQATNAAIRRAGAA